MLLIKFFKGVKRHACLWHIGCQRLLEQKELWCLKVKICFGPRFSITDDTKDGRITESGTYRELVGVSDFLVSYKLTPIDRTID